MRLGLWRVGAFGLMAVLLALAGCGTAAPTNQWQNVGPANAQINTLASDPHIRGIIFAGGSDGTTYLARGDKSGVFVTSMQSPGHGPVNIIFPNPYVKGAVYAGTAGGFYASSDYGNKYVAHNSGLPAEASVAAITTGADAATLYISVAGKGFYSSADGGKSWKAVVPSTATASLPANAVVQALLWDGASKALFAAVSGAGNGVYVSHDTGASWDKDGVGLPPKTDGYALLELTSGGGAPSGPALYIGSSSGVYTRASGAATWKSANTGLPTETVYSLATYFATPELLYAGTGQTVYTSTDGGQHWAKVADGLAHAVPAIVVVPGQNTPTVTFVAAGQIARYPAVAGSGGGIFSTLLLVVIVGAAAWFVLARYRLVPGLPKVWRRVTRRGES
ncbi:MAG TPA: hypothetical protein VJO13_02645 [Ktedonobacterales bacterium]|nr:hypothetical protein [Ktedonobacterales bacterium]